MRQRYRYDKGLKKVVPIELWRARNEYTTNKAHMVIGDIEPYQAVTGDMAGKWITSRSEHKAFLQRNNLVEVGNEQAYMTRNGGMTDDNPNLMSDEKREEQICQSLMKNLDQLKRRR